jgi:hypothetical protein
MTFKGNMCFGGRSAKTIAVLSGIKRNYFSGQEGWSEARKESIAEPFASVRVRRSPLMAKVFAWLMRVR